MYTLPTRVKKCLLLNFFRNLNFSKCSKYMSGLIGVRNLVWIDEVMKSSFYCRWVKLSTSRSFILRGFLIVIWKFQWKVKAIQLFFGTRPSHTFSGGIIVNASIKAYYTKLAAIRHPHSTLFLHTAEMALVSTSDFFLEAS